MKKWIYPEVIEKLKYSCERFLKGFLTVLEIQSEIYVAAHKIVALEEKWLRSILFDAENEIELLIYTVNDNQLIDSVNLVVNKILSHLSDHNG